MAAAYAALVSLSNVLHQFLNPPPTHDFFFPRERAESLLLRDTVSSLIEFLETYPSRLSQEIEDMEERIVGAVYEAEDIIESNVVRSIEVKYAMGQELAIGELLSIAEVIETFISIRRELNEIKNREVVEDVIPQNSTTISSSSTSRAGGINIMVGFEEHLDRIRIVLASDVSNLQIVPIVGMGGIGKTTLASNVYKDACIIERFDIRGWVSVSQQYEERDIVIALLQQIDSRIDGNGLSVDELGLLLYKELFGRRYLIVLDDLWEIQAWDRLYKFLPENSNESRILVTTRQVDLARDIESCKSLSHEMSLLDEDKSWDLIHEYVKKDCPIELTEIGKRIARGCRGLPLALVVIGGLLARSEKTRDFWVYVEANVTSTANYANDEQCLNVLRLSYSQLPVHLKPCFLYLAVFPKSFEICISKLIRLWVAEGFIKPASSKSLEEVAEAYVKDLLDRNLVMISKRGLIGKVKKCSIHDFISELCTTEAQKTKFLCIAKLDEPNTLPQLESERRLSVHVGSGKEKVYKAVRLGKHNRSLFSYSAWESRRHIARGLKLLRVLDVMDSYSMDEIMLLFNSRYISCAIPRESHVSSCLSLLWNLQTLVFHRPISLPSKFWSMPQIRHLKIPGITLADPSDAEVDDENVVVLKNLQTLKTVRDFIFSKNVLRRIPNLKKLGIDRETTEAIESFGLSNLASLDKLESLVLKCRGTWEYMAFPQSLKKLTLSHCQIPWEDMSVVGSLPNLEVLKLLNRAATGKIWKPNAGEFRRLKFLLIDWSPLEIWEADDTHFPSLEHLQLVRVRMEEFPVDFAQIETLRTIDLNYCSGALSVSAKTMSRSREYFGYDDIQIRAFPSQASRSREKRKKHVVGLEDEAEKLKGYLLEESEELDVISIVGQGGLGKTTLAEKIFHDPEITREFPKRLWFTVSAEKLDMKNVNLQILKLFTGITRSHYRLSEEQLAEFVSGFLVDVRFLLVFDDLRTPEDWDRIQYGLPRTNKRAKVLITTCQVEICWHANHRRGPHELRLLTPEESWLLLQLEVSGKPEFPLELEAEGKLFADQCRGLPFAIVFVGGILVKKLAASDEISTVKAAMKEASENFSAELDFYSIFMILSYEKLPYHLRKCFLYLGMFPRDYEIPTWKLIPLWIAEGFIRQEESFGMEETAENYLEDLISSNLLTADKLYADGKVKTCRIHYLLRDICLRKAIEENDIFFQEICTSRSEGSNPPVAKEYERICIHSNVLNFLSGKPYCPSVRSFVCFSKEDISVDQEHASAIACGFKLLRVLDVMPLKIAALPSDMHELLHLRYLALSINSAVIPAAFSKFQNIQTLLVHTTSQKLHVKADILNMIQLRHFKTNASATLPKPSTSSEGGENIQTLGMISPESCTKEVFDRARNLKKLGIRGKLASLLGGKNRSFNSLGKLENLEKLRLIHDASFLTPRLFRLPPADKFPIKLRSLTLHGTSLNWKHMSILGSLENLEVLKLKDKAFRGSRWSSSDGGFPHLEVLHIVSIDLEIWVASHHHFPRLKSLKLHNCQKLREVPVGLADIPNFQQLNLIRCTRTALLSAKRIEEKKRGAYPFHLSFVSD